MRSSMLENFRHDWPLKNIESHYAYSTDNGFSHVLQPCKGSHLLWKTVPAILYGLLAVCSRQDDYRIELGIIQLVHGIGSDVEQCMASSVHDVSYC